MELWYNVKENAFFKDCEDESMVFEVLEDCRTKNMTNWELNEILRLNVPYELDEGEYVYKIQDVFDCLGYSEYEVEATISRSVIDRVVAKNPMDACDKVKEYHREHAKEKFENGFKVECSVDF